MKRGAQADGVPAFAVKVNYKPLKDTVDWQITRITVDDQVDLPSMFTLELDAADEIGAEAVWLDDASLFAIADEVEIQLGGIGAELKTVITGEVTLVEAECAAASLPRLIVRGYDRRHRLQRGQKVRTFVKKKDSQVAEQIAKEAGLRPSAIDSKITHDYLVQANQTDFAFLQTRARQLHYELVVENKTLHFRPVAYTGAAALTLSMENELSEFRAQLSTAGQVNKATVRGWSVKEKKIITADAKSSKLMQGKSGGAKLIQSFGQASALVCDVCVADKEAAQQQADATFAASALGLIRGEGRCPGRTDLMAGKVVEIKGIGKRFSGPYYLTAVTHNYGPDGYTTQFIGWRNAT